jgi:hypothetical protein
MATRKPARAKTIRSWKQARPLFEKWRKACASVKIELRRPRVIDLAPIDFLRGEPAAGTATQGTRIFRGRLIYHTPADVTIRRPSGAILIIDNHELAALSDSRARFEPPAKN